MKSKSKSTNNTKRGMALVVTLSMMILLSVLAVGLLSLSTISLRMSDKGQAILKAKANARLALMQAIGELQKHAGPDQRVTTTSGILDEATEKHWTGVWSTESEDSKPVWLVSGNDSKSVSDLDELQSYPSGYFEPQSSLDDKNSYVFYKGTGKVDERVRAPLVDVYGESKDKKEGRYAWWVSDEGTKARVNLMTAEENQSVANERSIRAMVTQEPNLGQIDGKIAPLSDPNSDLYDKKEFVVSLQTASHALGEKDLVEELGHDITTGGYGLPVNVVDGGMKADLSVVFDTSQERNSLIQSEECGARFKEASEYFEISSVKNPSGFYLDENLSQNGAKQVGPNWGILYNYGRLWKSAQANSMKMLAMKPNIQSDIGENRWAPYTKHSKGAWGTDTQHISSSVAPVLSFIQMGFRLKANPTLTPIPNTDPEVRGHRLQLEVKPVIGIWNPYNVKISAKPYTFVWWLYPYIRVAANTPNNIKGYPQKWIRSEIFLRNVWQDQFHGNDTAFKLRTQSVDFEPGEMRLFSVTGTAGLTEFNDVTSSWNEEGAFVFDLSHTYGNDVKSGQSLVAGEPYIIPPGSTAWFGDAFMDDVMSGPGRAWKPNKLVDGEVATKIWFHQGSNNSIHRIADLWPVAPRSVAKPRYDLPERIISSYNRTGGKVLGDYPVEYLTKTPVHLGTWRFYSRTSADAAGGTASYPSQRIRNWVDSNPRFGAANPAWDGSVIDGSKGEGFHFISPFIGGSLAKAPSGYAPGPSGRGKVAEGQDEAAATPEADFSSGRYRGFGGYSYDSVDGETHLPLFDVPRGPLVSLGQFQHAQLSRYAYEPALPFANSYANIRIPLDETFVNNFGEIDGFTMSDSSYELNERLWDRYFFSTMGVDYKSQTGNGSIDDVFDFDKLASGETLLTNTRHRFIPFSSDEKISDIVRGNGKSGAKAISARIGIEGAFNVHSTSVSAWKAILSSMENFEFPVVSMNGTKSWANDGGVRLPRFGHVMQESGWEGDSEAGGPEFWSGYRTISDDELTDLAEELVKEIRERSKDQGPFRSLADFVNRDPNSTEERFQRSGVLQAAIDKTINSKTIGALGPQAQKSKGNWFPEGAVTNDSGERVSQAAGSAGYLMQSDLLQALAPVLQVRSDYFRIRTVGQAVDAAGNITATAVCEAFVQRKASYVNPEDEPHRSTVELIANENELFGRKFEIVSFKWLSSEEV